MTTTGLAKYDAMCTAIAVCSRVDEAKEIRDKARALEVYAKQAQNTEAERKAGEIRLRAERRAGELLREMKQRSERHNGRGGDQKSVSRASTLKLPDLGITRDQSSQWQKLADIPEREFEAEISKPGPKPTTEGLLNSRRAEEKPPKPQMDPNALWVWGRIREFERGGIIEADPAKICAAFTESMRDDVKRLLPELIDWLESLRKSCK
jgi:hypothetical protein